jgi:hypothetical protein
MTRINALTEGLATMIPLQRTGGYELTPPNNLEDILVNKLKARSLSSGGARSALKESPVESHGAFGVWKSESVDALPMLGAYLWVKHKITKYMAL